MLKPRSLLCFIACSLFLQVPLASAGSTPTLTIWAFLHDELSEISDEQLQKDYFDAWLTEMSVIVPIAIKINFRRNVSGLTDIDYRQLGPSRALSAWSDAAFAWRRKHNSAGGLVDNKYLLIVQDVLGTSDGETVAGLAYQTGHAAIASMRAYSTVGHELGHTLSATHEQSRVNFNGWFCETYMFPSRFGLRSNCYQYSDENRANIANYLKRLL